MRTFLAILLISTLAACVSAAPSSHGFPEVDPANPHVVANGTKYVENINRGHIEYTGPIIFEKNNILNRHYLLRAWRNSKTKKFEGAQIYIALPSSDWVFYDSAFSAGKQLSVTKIDRDIGSCSQYGCHLTETIGINLSHAQLKSYAKSGFMGELSGKRGSLPIIIPAGYFEGFLTVLK